jgi:adenosylcobinamide-phosphate synthase
MEAAIVMSLAILLIAVTVDQCVGEFPRWAHPVVWMGKAISLAVAQAPRQGWWFPFLFGAFLTIGLCSISALAAWFVLRLAAGYPTLQILVGAYLLKASFSIRELDAAAGRVESALEAGELDAGREALRSLCSRDPSTLDSDAVAAGVVESVAENASDSIVAPLFYFVLLGVPGAIGYRAINTLDAMIGYRNERFEALGKFAARLDDVVNWLPARLTALLLLFAGLFVRLDVRGGWSILRRDGSRTPSPNAGRPMAAMAGMLKVALAKPGVYVLGDALEPLSLVKLRQARRVMKLAAWSTIFLATAGVICLRLPGG